MTEHDDSQGPEKPSTEGRRKAAALGTSPTPPPGTPKRIYFFAAAPEGKVDAEGIAEHIADLREVLDASARSSGDDQP
jgi:hypothetical protein